MRLSKVSVASICPLMALADPHKNLQRVQAWCAQAAQKHVDLELFPEVNITGYMAPRNGPVARR